MTKKSLFLSLMGLAIPMAAQNSIAYGVALADNIMVGLLGDLPLSAVFVANQVQSILQMFTLGLGATVTVLAAQLIGRGDTPGAKAVVAVGFYVSLGVGFLFTLLSFVAPRMVLGLFTNETVVINAGAGYLRVVCGSYFFFCVSSLLLSALRVVKAVKIGVFSTAIGFVVNVCLNYLLIFGKLGLPRLGVVGAAMATCIARVVEMIVVCVYTFRFDKKLHFIPKNLLQTRKDINKAFRRHGIPIISGDLLWGVGGAVQVAIIGRLGVEVLAANTIAGNLHQVFGVLVYGTAGAAAVLVGQAVGRGNKAQVKTLAKNLQYIFLAIVVATGILLFICRYAIINIAYPEISGEAYSLCIQFITVLSVTIVGTAYQMSVLTGIVRAGGATSFVLVNDLFFVWLVVVPFGALAAFVFHAPPAVVFALLKCDQILKCIVAYCKLHKWDWMIPIHAQRAM